MTLRPDMMQTFVRFTCDGCGKKYDYAGVDRGGFGDDAARPPKSWRFVDIGMFRSANPKADANAGRSQVGLVCSPPCAATLCSRAWPDEEATA